jgi:hypothetical protein
MLERHGPSILLIISEDLLAIDLNLSLILLIVLPIVKVLVLLNLLQKLRLTLLLKCHFKF